MFNNHDIKNRIKDILIYYGADPPKDGQYNWSCIPGRHNNPKNNLSVKGNLCCCHCGLKGDSFSVVAEMEDLNCGDKKDFLLIVKKACEILNLPRTSRQICNDRIYNNRVDKNVKVSNFKIKNDYLTKIISKEFAKTKKNKYIYFLKRGLSFELMAKHKVIVVNPKKIFPQEIVPRFKNAWVYEYIIPVWKDGEVVNCILRRNDYKDRTGNKTLNLKGYNVEFLNSDYLRATNLKYLFICEGWADALTFEEVGRAAIAINSINMINKFVESVKENMKILKNTTFFIAFDDDKTAKKNWGQIAAIDLLKRLKALNLRAFNLKMKNDYKDINEYYCRDKISFMKSLNGLFYNFKY